VNVGIFEQQLSSVVDEFRALQAKSPHDDLSDLPKENRQALVTRAIAAISRITGNASTYSKEVSRLLQSMPLLHLHTTSILGVAKALLDDIKAGYLRTLVEIVHGDVFADFLEMAQHLCDTGYKDAAAVIAGSTLESHIRSLCQKAGIPVETIKANDAIVAKKADAMNAELTAAAVYSKLDQKNITAWLDLRNKAAHGKYGDYNNNQVGILSAGIRDFITRNPA
jgi:hypothetical protein